MMCGVGRCGVGVLCCYGYHGALSLPLCSLEMKADRPSPENRLGESEQITLLDTHISFSNPRLFTPLFEFKDYLVWGRESGKRSARLRG
jgi:hypothetical protein